VASDCHWQLNVFLAKVFLYYVLLGLFQQVQVINSAIARIFNTSSYGPA
jgi:hypothetical protein